MPLIQCVCRMTTHLRRACILYFLLFFLVCCEGRISSHPVGVLMRSNMLSENNPASLKQAMIPTSIDHIKSRKVLPWIPNGIKNGLASGLATVLVKLILQPFDTLKTVQQMQRHAHLSIPAAATYVVKSRGVLGLWSGALVGAFGAAPSVALYFTVYSTLRQHLTKMFPAQHRLFVVGCASCVANTIACVLRVPYEVYKQRIQAGMYANVVDAVVGSWKTEGLMGLFMGGKLASQVMRDVPYALITAVLYDFLQNPQSHLHHVLRYVAQYSHTHTDMLCGAVAGGASSFLTVPMDVVKTRLMTAGSIGNRQYASLPHAISNIYQQEGMTAFFAGWSSRLLHKVPANALFFVFFETFRVLLGAVNKRSEQ